MNNEEYWYWICNIDGVWRGTICNLMKLFKHPRNVYQCVDEDLKKILENNMFKKDITLADRIIRSRNEEKIISGMEKMKKKNIRFISNENELYPDRFKKIADYPYGIYLRGNNTEFDNPAVAIVGARNCTSYGKKAAREIGFELAVNGVSVISGLARGIDAAGLWGAADAGGNSIAVMGCGVDICYPRENIELYERVMENGIILSDYPVGTQPLSWQFPLRNRLISALSDRVLVVEAKEKSGSLITVEYALEQGKDVFAVPGRIGDVLSSGCNRLIREGAGITTSAKDILNDIGITNVGINNEGKSEFLRKKNIVLEKEMETLYSYVDFFPKDIKQLVEETGRDSIEILRGLVKLQMMNLIEEPSKNYYSRKI